MDKLKAINHNLYKTMVLLRKKRANQIARSRRNIKNKKVLQNKIKTIHTNFNLFETKVRNNAILKMDEIKQRMLAEIEKLKTKQIFINKKALLVGINYKNTINELNGCINDVLLMQSLLTSKGFSDITLLTDDTELLPTKQNIVNSIIEILDNSKEGDLVCFYYSGHGSNIMDRNNDEKDRRDEVIVPLDLNYLLDDELKQIFNANLKPNVTAFCIFDSCFSGSVLDLKFNYLYLKNKTKVVINNKQLQAPGNIIMISGCNDRQYSTETTLNGDKVQGALTWFFNQMIEKQGEKNISWKNLLRKIKFSLMNNNFTQSPQLSADDKFNIDSLFFL